MQPTGAFVLLANKKQIAGGLDSFRNGKKTTTAKYTKPRNVNEAKSDKTARKTGDIDRDRGLHESWDWYNKCYTRQRNQGEYSTNDVRIIARIVCLLLLFGMPDV